MFLWAKNITQVNREKSSTIMRLYNFSQRLIILEGPIKSMCRSFSGLEVEIIFFDLKDILVCFPCKHGPHSPSLSKDIFGSPITKFFLTNFEIEFMWACPSLLYYNQSLSFIAIIQVPIVDATSSMVKTYTFLTL